MEQEKDTFLNRLKISVKDIEKYNVFAGKKVSCSIKYILKLVAIVMLIVSIFYTYKFNIEINSVSNMSELFADYDIPSDIKKEAIFILENTENYKILPVYFISNFILNFSVYSIITILDIVLLVLLGYVSMMFSAIRFKTNVLFNIATSAISLSVIAKGIYLIVNMMSGFTIEYFDIMYTSIAYIYMIAAILIIKSDFIKNEQELMHIIAEQEKIRQEFEEKERLDREEKNSDSKNDVERKKDEGQE